MNTNLCFGLLLIKLSYEYRKLGIQCLFVKSSFNFYVLQRKLSNLGLEQTEEINNKLKHNLNLKKKNSTFLQFKKGVAGNTGMSEYIKIVLFDEVMAQQKKKNMNTWTLMRIITL